MWCIYIYTQWDIIWPQKRMKSADSFQCMTIPTTIKKKKKQTKKNEIFPSVTTYTDLKDIMLKDISQRKTKAT